MRLFDLKTTIRNLNKNKYLTILNLAGLATGLAVTILIFNYTYQESKADNQYNNLENIYVLMNSNSAHVQYEMASLLRDQLPGIKRVTMVESGFKNEFILKYGTDSPVRSELIFADSSFTEIFNFRLVSGDLEDALTAPHSIILTESESNRLFNNENPIGKILSLRGTYDYFGNADVEVKAVIKNFPENSNLQFKAVVSQPTADKMMPWRKECIWSCSNVQNYVLLGKGQNPGILASQMNRQLRPLIPQEIACDFSFLPYRNVYFSNIRDDFKHGNLKLVRMLVFIALSILIIAIINYINLSIAGSLKRQTEVGVKKVFGVNPIQLFIHFLGESVLISFISMLLGVFLACMITPSLNSFSSIHVPELQVDSIYFWLVMITGSIIIGITAGFLPAMSFNKFRPILLITGRLKNQSFGITLKKGLIVFQFIISIILIICTITIARQLNYLQNTDMGFNSENIVNVKLSPEVKIDVFKNKLLNIPGIESFSYSRWFPGHIMENWGMPLIYKGVEKEVDFACENADASYVGLMGLKIIQGRNFSDSLKQDVGCALLNEAAVKAFGLDDPLEAVFHKEDKTSKVIGVIKDFNFESLHSQIRPLVIFCSDERLFSVNLKLSSGSFNAISNTLDAVRLAWNEVSPNFPFGYSFIDQEVENLYRSEFIFEKIFRWGSFFAIFISCLGLTGLVLSLTDHLKKEIGIRKVYGARIGEVLYMLNIDFIKWITMAFIIACPAAWYLIAKWLENFAYKIPLSWGIFAFAGLLTLSIGLLTVSWQCWNAAVKNPVETLRYE